MMLRGVILCLLIALCLLVALAAGEQWINPFDAGGQDAVILWDLRLPRLLIAFAMGGLLALAGAWFQVLLSAAVPGLALRMGSKSRIQVAN